MNLNSILIGSEDPKRLTDYYTRLNETALQALVAPAAPSPAPKAAEA